MLACSRTASNPSDSIRNVLAGGALSCFRTGVGNQLAHETIRILESDYAFFVEPRFWMLELDMVPNEPLDPESNRAGQNRE
jgi:hypothetical protein